MNDELGQNVWSPHRWMRLSTAEAEHRLRELNNSRDMVVRAQDLKFHGEPVDEHMSNTRKLAAAYRESLCVLLDGVSAIQGVVAAELRRVDEHAVEDKAVLRQSADASFGDAIVAAAGSVL